MNSALYRPRLGESPQVFSVVTVCLNPGKSLLITGESVLQQESVGFEWVIKDGLSTDCPPDFCKEDPRVRFVSQRDSGIFDAMNQALGHCRGEYVLFLNTGDVFCDSHMLGRVASAITESGRPEVLYTYYEYARPGNVLKYPARLTPSFLYRRSICHQATFIRRDCYARCGAFNPLFRVGADDELLARLILKERASQSRAPFACVRVEPWGFSSRPENRGEELRTRDYIRRHYLTPGQQLRGRLLNAATLPVVRYKWLSMPPASWQHRSYVSLSNFLNERL